MSDTAMSDTTRAILLGVFTLSSCIWVGGYIAIAVVARVATRTLAPGQRVAFFRALGRSYIVLGVPALLIAFGAGLSYAAQVVSLPPWSE